MGKDPYANKTAAWAAASSRQDPYRRLALCIIFILVYPMSTKQLILALLISFLLNTLIAISMILLWQSGFFTDLHVHFFNGERIQTFNDQQIKDIVTIIEAKTAWRCF
jgi:hypothetical protein